jgi:hypothetical protein
VDDSNFPVGHLKSITIIFGENDSLFPYRAVGISDSKAIQTQESQRFFEKFYPSAIKNGANVSLAVLPGNHIGLQLYPSDYVATALNSAGEARNSAIMPARLQDDPSLSKKTAYTGKSDQE